MTAALTPAALTPARLIANQSIRFVLRERTVALLAVMFVVLVLISAWLGWQATATVNRIYLDAAVFLQASGQPVPTNPVLDISPLSLMRNMSVYVSLIGALAAIVIGNRLITLDRKAGVLPLIGSRPLTATAYARGKIAALALLILGLSVIAGLVSVLTFALLPAISVTAAQWLQLTGFFGLSALYMMIFGLIGMAAGGMARSESVGLLVPVAPDAASDWAAAMAAAVGLAPAELHAVLHRMRLSLRQVDGFHVGQVIALPGITVGSVRLEATDGRLLARARLGQMAGLRAVRVQLPAAPEMTETRPGALAGLLLG